MDRVARPDADEQPRPERRGPTASAVARLAAENRTEPVSQADLLVTPAMALQPDVERLLASMWHASACPDLVATCSTLAQLHVEQALAAIRQLTPGPLAWLEDPEYEPFPPTVYLRSSPHCHECFLLALNDEDSDDDALDDDDGLVDRGQHREVQLPKQDAWRERWRRIWRYIKPMALRYERPSRIRDWLDKAHPDDRVEPQTLRKIIRLGRDGRLD